MWSGGRGVRQHQRAVPGDLLPATRLVSCWRQVWHESATTCVSTSGSRPTINSQSLRSAYSQPGVRPPGT